MKEELRKCELTDTTTDSDVKKAPPESTGDKTPSTQPRENAPTSMDDDHPEKGGSLAEDERLPMGLTGGDTEKKAVSAEEAARALNEEKVTSENKAEHISTAEASGSFAGINHPYLHGP